MTTLTRIGPGHYYAGSFEVVRKKWSLPAGEVSWIVYEHPMRETDSYSHDFDTLAECREEFAEREEASG